jgi:DNA-binding beta-propeller fold protein YncE
MEATEMAEVEEAVVVEETPSQRIERRKLLLLALLAAAAVALLTFSAWYLLFRKPITEFPLPGIVQEQMPGYSYSIYGATKPTGIAVTPDGSRIYVAQTNGESAVLIYDGHGTPIGELRPPAAGSGHTFVYVAINPTSGEVYVTDRPSAAIYVYSPEGEYLRQFEPPASLEGWQPLGIGFDTAGTMFVTDPSVNVVHEFDAQGTLLRTVGSAGQLSFPNSAIEDSSGRLYISDSNNGRLLVLDPNGSQLAVIRRGPADGDLGLPRGMAIDDQQRLYVVDTVDQSVKVYRASPDPIAAPEFLGFFGTHGNGEGAFSFPNAVATDARGRVYVADWNNDRVQVWTY